MAKLLMFLCCLMPFTMAYGQNEEENTQKGIKFYLHISNNYSPKAKEASFVPSLKKVSFLTPSFAFFLKKERFYTEIGLSDWYVQTRSGGLDIDEKLINIGLRFEQGWKIGKKIKPLQVYLGAGVQPYIQDYKLEARTSSDLEVISTAVGVQIQFIPKLTYQYPTGWFIDVSLPIVLFDSYFDSNLAKSPNFTIRLNQRNWVFNTDILSRNIILRFGVGKSF